MDQSMRSLPLWLLLVLGQWEAPGHGKKHHEESKVRHLLPGLASGVPQGAASAPEGLGSFPFCTTSAVSRF